MFVLNQERVMNRRTRSRSRTDRRPAILLAWLLIALALAGCVRLAPRTTALNTIHQSYRTEFQQFLPLTIPAPGKIMSEPIAPASDQPAFAQTLREIREYRLKYGEDSRESAHLKVLEGMIYLQSGQIGMARLLQDDLQEAGRNLNSGTGAFTRDQLLAANFSSLVDGWEQILLAVKLDEGFKVEKLEAAADRIAKALTSLDASKLAQPDVDEGAIYIATTAAIFYVWVYNSHSSETPDPRAVWFKKGSDLIGRFLTETEKKIARQADQRTSPGGRLRYLSWYGFLTGTAPN